MAKKTSIKVRLVPENKPDSPFYYYVKNKVLHSLRSPLDKYLTISLLDQILINKEINHLFFMVCSMS